MIVYIFLSLHLCFFGMTSSTNEVQTPLRFTPSTEHLLDPTQNWLSPPALSWVSWIVVSSNPPEPGGEGGYNVDTDEGRAAFLRDFDPDVIDWIGGTRFNRADYARARGVASSCPSEYEYEESLQFAQNDTLRAFADDGISRDELNRPKVWGRINGQIKYYMELNAPKWKETVLQVLKSIG